MAETSTASQTVSSLKAVAAHFGVSYDTVRKEWRKAGMPGSAGAYDLAEIARWKEARGKDPAQIAAAGTEVTDYLVRKRAAEARVKEAEAQRRERENRLAEEEVCYRSDVESFLSGFFSQTRDLHARLIEEISPQFPEAVRQDLAEDLRTRLELVQRTLHAWAGRLTEISE